MKRLSLNSDGAFRTTIQRRTPHARNKTSTETKVTVRPTMTSGGETKVRIRSATLTNPHRSPNFFISDASVIFTAFAERTRNITEILQDRT
ncbi:CLUMA_CG015498, isoform A [Clunio marinus]|uniref:CLUMA_CG015498, isoform A n=1 Tax=Clunio marinus TaxID=568069 RepID=A0A1J1IQX6_9DIPT|nr:CLUMA_CG015498, isoform A [Clunio marinus]